MLIGSVLAIAGVVDEYFSIATNNLDYYTVVAGLSVSGVFFLLTTSSCISLKTNRCGGTLALYGVCTVLLSTVVAIGCFVELHLLMSLDFLNGFVNFVFSMSEQNCCIDFTGARLCYPFYDACTALQTSNTTFQVTAREQLEERQFFIVGGTLFVTLLLLTAGVSAVRVCCLISCGSSSVDVDDGDEIVKGQVVYIIDAFLDARGGKKGVPIVYAGNSFYNVETWPRAAADK